MRSKTLVRAVVGLAVLLWVVAPAALADSQARIVRVSYLSGDVELDRRDGRGFEPAFLNMPVIESMRAWTRGDGYAEVEFEDGSTLRLVPDTRVEFQELRRRSTGETVTLVELQEGTAYFNLIGGDDIFRLVVGRNEALIEKSARFRATVERGEIHLAVHKGRLEVIGAGGSAEVRKGETLAMNLEDDGRYHLARGARPHDYDEWDRDREDERVRYAQARQPAAVGYSYAYGVPDLFRYGSYFHVPGYGYLWRPHQMSYGWSPFYDGSWVYYPRHGWVWVSSYPWGWVPYRYGHWLYVTNYGWCWQPQSGWGTWAAAPVVSNPPAHWTSPRPPRGRDRGPVTVGRSYRDVLEEAHRNARRDGNGAGGGNGSGGTVFHRARDEAERRRSGDPTPAADTNTTDTTTATSAPVAPPAPARTAGGESRPGGSVFDRAREEAETRRSAPAPAPTPPAAAPAAPAAGGPSGARPGGSVYERARTEAEARRSAPARESSRPSSPPPSAAPSSPSPSRSAPSAERPPAASSGGSVRREAAPTRERNPQ